MQLIWKDLLTYQDNRNIIFKFESNEVIEEAEEEHVDPIVIKQDNKGKEEEQVCAQQVNEVEYENKELIEVQPIVIIPNKWYSYLNNYIKSTIIHTLKLFKKLNKLKTNLQIYERSRQIESLNNPNHKLRKIEAKNYLCKSYDRG